MAIHTTRRYKRNQKTKLVEYKVNNEYFPKYGKMTLRQIFYKLVSEGILINDKSDSNDLSKILCKLRREGRIDPEMIIDTTREIIYQKPYKDPQHFIQKFNQLILDLIDVEFSLEIWQDQICFPIILLEKHALESFFKEVAIPYHVPLIVSRGYTSHTKMYELEKLIPQRKPLVFITFSDYDPSGKTMASSLPKILEECIPFFQTHTVVGALTDQQIKQYNLPMITKEYKVKGSKRKVRKQICELDALDPNDLRQIIRESIEYWINDKPKFNQRLKDLDNEKQKLKTAYINTLKNLNIP
jgi:hypothetical protein